MHIPWKVRVFHERIANTPVFSKEGAHLLAVALAPLALAAMGTFILHSNMLTLIGVSVSGAFAIFLLPWKSDEIIQTFNKAHCDMLDAGMFVIDKISHVNPDDGVLAEFLAKHVESTHLYGDILGDGDTPYDPGRVWEFDRAVHEVNILRPIVQSRYVESGCAS